ncbi:MAG: hypothetical protein H7263_15135 [Candidatus Sericytochromatia bacterium]|nr:hypothetical protein [Candidatus Sericytochromatia bacterium]
MLIRKLIILITLSVIFTNNSFAMGQFERMKNGEILVEDSINSKNKNGSVKMTFIINQSPEKIWDLLIKYDKWPNFMPDLEKVIIKENRPDHAVVYVKAKAPLGINISYTLKRIYNNKKYLITWTMIEGKAKSVDGSWQIFPLKNNMCKIIYTNYVDLGYMISPKIVSMLTKNKLPNLANGMREYLKNN